MMTHILSDAKVSRSHDMLETDVTVTYMVSCKKEITNVGIICHIAHKSLMRIYIKDNVSSVFLLGEPYIC